MLLTFTTSSVLLTTYTHPPLFVAPGVVKCGAVLVARHQERTRRQQRLDHLVRVRVRDRVRGEGEG